MAPVSTAPPGAKNNQPQPLVLSVGGGKGGTGKSLISFNLARALAAEGLEVVLADTDLGGASLHILAGLRHCERTLRDFIGGRVKELASLMVNIPDAKVFLIPGSPEPIGIAQSGYQKKLKLIRHLRRLPAQVVVCDLGGDSNLDTLDIFNESDIGILVTTPEPTAIQGAYGFAKAALIRRLIKQAKEAGIERSLAESWWSAEMEKCPSPQDILEQTRSSNADAARQLEHTLCCLRQMLIINQSGEEEGKRLAASLRDIFKKFMLLELEYLGHIPSEPAIGRAVLQGQLPRFSVFPPVVMIHEKVQLALEPNFVVGVNEQVAVGQEVFHVQTEDLGCEVGAFHTLVYSGGQILLSKRLSYDDAFFSRAPSRLKQERVRFLHRTIVAALKMGKLPLAGRATPGAGPTRLAGESHGGA